MDTRRARASPLTSLEVSLRAAEDFALSRSAGVVFRQQARGLQFEMNGSSTENRSDRTPHLGV